MTLHAKKIIGLGVETKSGQHLGRVQNFSLDPMTQAVTDYTVKSDRLLGELFAKELIIGASQVVSLTEEKMVVDDLVLKEGVPNAVPSSSPVVPTA